MNHFVITLGLSFTFFILSCSNGSQQKQADSQQNDTIASIKEVSIKEIPLNKNEIPQEIKYQGEIKSILHWTDKTGKYIAIQTETGPIPSKDQDESGKDAELTALCFVFNQVNNQYEQIWKITDHETNCQVDIEAAFIQGTFQLSDHNKNGIPEVWNMYKTACRGDVSPSQMKIIMYEGGNKHAMRGRNLVDLGNGQKDGGEYHLDKAFTSSDSAITNFAKKLWADNILQKWN